MQKKDLLNKQIEHIDIINEQMVVAETTLVLPLIISYEYHGKKWEMRNPHRYNALL